jgi:cell division protein FtsI (penicillin-binding protein 3)
MARQLENRRPVLRDPLQDGDRPDAAFDANWRRAYRRRLLIVGVVLAVWTAGIEARLIFLQVIRHPFYLAKATDQQSNVEVMAPKRGELLDRNGDVLAYSVDADTVVASPRLVRDAAKTVEAMCAVFADCTTKERTDVTALLSKSSHFAYVRRGISPDVARRLMALELPGIRLETESKRYYPKRELAAHILGFVGRDNNGLGGVEQAFDSKIRGKAGRVLHLTDAKQRSFDSRVELAPTTGATLELTIDQTIQFFAERELRRGVEEHRATAGTAIVMDPATGDILALANYPSFNPNTPGAVDADLRRNRAIQEIYEPGSTFKLVTAAAAIEEGVFTPSDMIDTAPGVIKIGSRKPINDEHRYGLLSFEDVIVKSSNVGAIKAGLKIGAERLNRYVHRFGFGERLSTDFRGASAGIVWAPERLDESALASVSMGYQIGVTPLQMVTAAAAVANGGTLMQPRIVRAWIRDGHREELDPVAVRTVISPSTASTLTTIMEAVVERGTATRAKIDGYQVAGKTGTAQKIIDGRYSESDHTGSFVGFVPARKPRFAILVVIDRPKAGGYYGGVVAAPVFQRIATAAMQYVGVPRSINPTSPVVITADATLMARPSTSVASAQAVSYTTDGQVLMPNLAGLGARDAMRVLTGAGLFMRASGTGVVVSQFPVAGTPVEAGDAGVVRLDRLRTTGGSR